MTAKKRDNKYYLQRIELDHPHIYADYLAGKFKTVGDARRAAGMLSPRTRLHELKNAWSKSSAVERREFAQWITISGLGAAAWGLAKTAVVDGKLEYWATMRLQQIIESRGMKMGAVMIEMGMIPLDASLGMALHRGTRIRPAVAAAVERWLDDNKAVR